MVRWRRGYAPACKAEYTGSNPVRTSNKEMFLQFKKFYYYNHTFSGVAQLVEQATVNRWVTGSSPVAGAIL